MAHIENSDSSVPSYRMAALGRRFYVGQLYNAINDSCVEEDSDDSGDDNNLQNILDCSLASTFSEKLTPNSHKEHGVIDIKRQVDVLSFNENLSSVANKHAHMSLDQHLKATSISGLINPVEGAARYGVQEPDYNYANEPNMNEAVKAVCLRLLVTDGVSNKNSRSASNKKQPQEGSSSQATHKVVGIEWGAEAYCVFVRQLSTDENKEAVEEQMETTLAKLANALYDGLAGRRRRLTFPARANAQYKCRFYGDLHSHTGNCSLDKAYQLFRDIIRRLERDANLAVPVTVTLQPIDNASIVQPMSRWLENGNSEEYVDEIEQVLGAMADSVARINTMLMKNKVSKDDKWFQRLRATSWQPFVDHLVDYMKLLRKQLSVLIPKIRSGTEDPTVVKTLLKVVDNGQFSPEKLEKWILDKENETRVIRALSDHFLTPQENFRHITTQDELESALKGRGETKWTVLLVLPSLEPVDRYVTAMKTYIKSHSEIDGQEEHEGFGDGDQSAAAALDIVDRPWHESADIRIRLLRTVRRLQQLLFNRSSKDGMQRPDTFMMASAHLVFGQEESIPYEPTIRLYRDGELFNAHFVLPDAPQFFCVTVKDDDDAVRAADANANNDNKLLDFTLEWSCEPSDNVTHYVIQQRAGLIENDDDGWFRPLNNCWVTWHTSSTVKSFSTAVDLNQEQQQQQQQLWRKCDGCEFRVAAVTLVGRSGFSDTTLIHRRMLSDNGGDVRRPASNASNYTASNGTRSSLPPYSVRQTDTLTRSSVTSRYVSQQEDRQDDLVHRRRPPINSGWLQIYDDDDWTFLSSIRWEERFDNHLFEIEEIGSLAN